MDVVTGAVSTLLPKLGDLLTHEYQLQASVRDDVAFLKAELESMEAALLGVSEASPDGPPGAQDRLWAREVRELSYDAEDCVEAFLVRMHHHAPPAPDLDLGGLRGLVDRGLGLLRRAKIRRDMGAEVRDIKRRVVEVGERRVRYRVDGVRGPPAAAGVRLSALYTAAAELVGTQERSRELVRLLMAERGEDASKRLLKTVSVVGFGGLGKTTLARVVYEELRAQFDCAAFVCISHDPDMEKVFRDMLCQLDKNCNTNIVTCGGARVIEQLREFLRDKSYFIVIDDIWSCSVWNTVRHAFIENRCGSRIITTTRILDVAKQAPSIYELRPLSPAYSRKLFYKRIFGTEDRAPPNHLAEVSENILKKCGGVPLAVITIASLLATKMRKENTDKYWYQVYQSMGSGLEESMDVKDMRRILSISYYDLPPHLKTCLLYLTSLYSEDYGIIIEKVIYKLIGEGIVRKQHGKTLYEVGEDYFEDLINRSIIQPMFFNHGSKVWSCCLHDMMLDLIASVSSEENLLQALGGGTLTMPEPTSKIRRLSLQNMKHEDVKKVAAMNLSHLRSLTVSPEAFALLPTLSSFPIIRVLDLHSCSQVDNSHCKHICNLYHLRYLKLSSTSIAEIPNEIGNLQLLQFLDLDRTNIKQLPPTLVQLRKLEFLCVDNRTTLPQHLGGLRSLQKLSPSVTIRSPSMLLDLSRLTELRRLMLRFDDWDDKRYEEAFAQCLSSLVNLESLQVCDCHNGLGSNIGMLQTPGPQRLRSINIGPGTVACVPRWMPSVSALSALDITLLTLQEEDLQVLGSIPSLRILYIWVKEHRKDRHKRLAIIGSDDGDCPFRCLTKLRIGPGAMEVKFAAGAMRELRTLRLDLHVRHTLDQFGDLECGLERLSSLERVVVHMNCYRAEIEEVEAAEASIRRALGLNPSRPTLELEKHGGSWRSG